MDRLSISLDRESKIWLDNRTFTRQAEYNRTYPRKLASQSEMIRELIEAERQREAKAVARKA